jgi:hypothetical protein
MQDIAKRLRILAILRNKIAVGLHEVLEKTYDAFSVGQSRAPLFLFYQCKGRWEVPVKYAQ